MKKHLPPDFLRPYQMGDIKTGCGGVTEIRRNLKRGDKVICFQGPTGMGKTRIFSYITHGAAIRNNVVWIIVHRKELLRQAMKSLDEMGVEYGVVSPLFTPNPFAMVQVISIDTLANRMHKIKTIPKIIIADEFHHSVSPTWFKVLNYYISKGSRVLGFTATPNRLDGKGLGKDSGGLCDSLVIGPQPQELIDMGFLAKPMIFAANLASIEGLHKKFGEFKSDEVESLMDRPRIIGDAVKSYTDICRNVPMITFVRSLKMAAHVEAQYRAAGFQAAMVDGKMDDRERNGRINALGTGGLHVLISCQLIDEGVDVPIVGAIQLLDPTTSVSRFLQRTGRGARMFPGKKGYYLLDHVSSTFYPNMVANHGDPSWNREWSLDGSQQGTKKKEKDEDDIKVRQCEGPCYAVYMASLPKCPVCGRVPEVSSREIEQVAGKLDELDAKRLQEIEENRKKMFARREEGMCRTLEDFQELAEKRGYAPGWAYHRYRSRRQRCGVGASI